MTRQHRGACTASLADVVTLAWHLGASYLPPGLDDAIDDARTATITPPRRTQAQRIADRITDMEQTAERVAEWLAEGRRRDRVNMLRALAAGAPKAEDRIAAERELELLAARWMP